MRSILPLSSQELFQQQWQGVVCVLKVRARLGPLDSSQVFCKDGPEILRTWEVWGPRMGGGACQATCLVYKSSSGKYVQPVLHCSKQITPRK